MRSQTFFVLHTLCEIIVKMDEPKAGATTVEVYPHLCDICQKHFATTSILYRHIRTVHNTEPVQHGTICCGMCSESFITYSLMTNHLVSAHSINIETDLIAFGSEEEFQNWKEAFEASTSSKFIKRTATRIVPRKMVETRTFVCHRSGKPIFRVDHESRKRKLKIKGSNKVGHHCPAKMTTFRCMTDCIEVEFVKTHVGHTIDVDRLTLSKAQRLALASALDHDVRVEEIIENVRSSIKDDKMERIHRLSRQDLANIARDFNIRKRKASDNDKNDDTFSVDAGTEMQSEPEDDPIRFYKYQHEGSADEANATGDDFLFVRCTCVDYNIHNMCKHIHSVCRSQATSLTTTHSAEEPPVTLSASLHDDTGLQVQAEDIPIQQNLHTDLDVLLQNVGQNSESIQVCRDNATKKATDLFNKAMNGCETEREVRQTLHALERWLKRHMSSRKQKLQSPSCIPTQACTFKENVHSPMNDNKTVQQTDSTQANEQTVLYVEYMDSVIERRPTLICDTLQDQNK